MHTVTFYPTGNADTCFIELANRRRIIFDYANTYDPNDEKDKRIDLEKEIRQVFGSDEEVDVLALSHLDKDHYKGASKLFWLEHANKYQSNDRIKVKTLWVPAAAILEEGIEDEGKIFRAEARHRLKKGKGIRVFSNPNALNGWLEDNEINPSDRQDCITHAGQPVPGFSLLSDGVEFFVHSPFSERCKDGSLVVRNDTALFMQVTFEVSRRKTRLILSADCPYEVMEAIVRVTKKHQNEDRLRWDINNIPHHTSYLSLSADKGSQKTIPTDDVRWLYEEQGEAFGLLISTSNLIPTEDTVQPPHKQAAAYYEDVATKLRGEFLVTMNEPKPDSPKPLVIEITGSGHKVKKSMSSPAIVMTTNKPPRAG
ncbi:hypothetical protein H6F90_12260 [Trichocoleus sp. FACHB-591]|uniref:hypothetical protein n=1 Tax=Trichocoleus sp. FACHB-591 TaxID=2692872 RepID=UPI001685E28F|nr:hypothetical protein [Trichocoleus sp. FACHB-591]MBD2095921.1 hypothetical protein [Trichocoleus sp. FACHB-591]